MEEIISKEEFDKILKVKGKIRGVAIKGEMEFILKEKGKKGLEKLEDAMAEIGYSIKYKEVKTISFYPLSLYGIIHLAMKNLFDFDDNSVFCNTGCIPTMGLWVVRTFDAKLSVLRLVTSERPGLIIRYLLSVRYCFL